MIGIYSIYNKVNGKQYIGSSKRAVRRYLSHMMNLENGKHHNKHLQASFDKHGAKAFTFHMLEFCKKSELLEREQYYLDTLPWDTLYNMAKEALGGGSNCVAIPVYLIDLDGNIVGEYPSVSELLRKFNSKANTYVKNTKRVFKRKYRIVTPEFYHSNLDEVKSWRNYTCEVTRKKKLANRPKYFLKKDGQFLTFPYCKHIAEHLYISGERVRQLLKEEDPYNRDGITFGTFIS